MKIAVGTPHTGTLKAQTAQAMAEMVAHTLSLDINYNGNRAKPEFSFISKGAGSLELKRTRIAVEAASADYLLLVDSDMIFPPNALVRLMTHNVPMVAANYRTRHGRGRSAAFTEANELVEPKASGLESVAAVGLGFCLLKPPILANVPKPWFVTEIGDEGELVNGEDVHFCNQVRSAGIPIYIDHALSREVGHIAERVLRLE